MTCRKGCGRTTTSCFPMLFRHIGAFVVAMALVSAGAQAQSIRPGASAGAAPIADRIQAGDRKGALELIATGADVNRAQPDGTTPLQWATYKVDRELVDRLLKRGAKANVTNRYGASPLHEAVRVA